MKTVKMMFSADMYYGQAENGNVTESLKKPLYEKDKVYDIEESMVTRWLKRGGVIVEAEAATKVEEKVETEKTETEEPVEGTDKKDEDEAKSAPAKSSKPASTGTKKK